MDILSRMRENLPAVKLPSINLPRKALEDRTVLEEEIELRRAISSALAEWECTRSNFETADCPEMVEYFTYKMKACEVKYQYLLKQMKSVKKEI